MIGLTISIAPGVQSKDWMMLGTTEEIDFTSAKESSDEIEEALETLKAYGLVASYSVQLEVRKD